MKSTPLQAISRVPAIAAVALLLLTCPLLAQSQAELEAEFEKTMNGAQLVGQFTVNGMDLPIQPESYSVSKVEKRDDGKWLFVASMKYMDQEFSLPMAFSVIWSGDTPVITVTDEPIEGMEGMFSARVLIYDGMYAGTWRHNLFSGQMFGKVVTEADRAAESESSGGGNP